VVFGQNTGNVRKQPRPIESLDLNVDEEYTSLRWGPFNLDDAIGVFQQGSDIAAVVSVHAHPRSPRHEANNCVAGDRRATAGKFDQNIISTPNQHP